MSMVKIYMFNNNNYTIKGVKADKRMFANLTKIHIFIDKNVKHVSKLLKVSNKKYNGMGSIVCYSVSCVFVLHAN